MIHRSYLPVLIAVVFFSLGVIVGVILIKLKANSGPIDLNPNSSCLYGGKTYRSGEGFPAADGCNSCSCENGNVACTLMACSDALE